MSENRQSGFTLLELMITLSVLAILTAMAYPSMQDFMKRNRVISVSNGIQADLQLARGEAAATRKYVSICPLSSAGTTSCEMSSGSYDFGWLVYTSTTPFTAYDSRTDSLEHMAPAAVGISIRSSYGGVLTYNARGEFLVSGTANPTGAFMTCAKSSDGDSVGVSTSKVPGILLVVANSGRIASTSIAPGDACS